jgi:hypothetical protein
LLPLVIVAIGIVTIYSANLTWPKVTPARYRCARRTWLGPGLIAMLGAMSFD